jgi:hypothetical protein
MVAVTRVTVRNSPTWPGQIVVFVDMCLSFHHQLGAKHHDSIRLEGSQGTS